MDWYLDILRHHYADFDGRARRKEYWMFVLVNLGIYIAIAVVAGVLSSIWEPLGWIAGLAYVAFALGVMVPSIAVGVRRLHDTGKTGWLMLLGMIPLANLVLLYFMIVEGDPGPNEYGPDPKEVGALAGDLY
ncbi:DUF805 domain-containing protein [Rubrivirga sp.]|uniref:DUF805 domain-containing protein n=1 Tax=Rubrivirga sp. TaxID=1885344 RepID=UPI003B51BCCC